MWKRRRVDIAIAALSRDGSGCVGWAVIDDPVGLSVQRHNVESLRHILPIIERPPCWEGVTKRVVRRAHDGPLTHQSWGSHSVQTRRKTGAPAKVSRVQRAQMPLQHLREFARCGFIAEFPQSARPCRSKRQAKSSYRPVDRLLKSMVASGPVSSELDSNLWTFHAARCAHAQPTRSQRMPQSLHPTDALRSVHVERRETRSDAARASMAEGTTMTPRSAARVRLSCMARSSGDAQANIALLFMRMFAVFLRARRRHGNEKWEGEGESHATPVQR
jgi:hypothetical protein